MIIKPKNWVDFQHYKDRCPPWIKLHKTILDNYEFQILPDASKALAMCLWLVASEHLDGEIDADSTKLAFRFRQGVEKIEKSLKPLIDGGFFFVVHCASNALADGKQDAPLDRGETETYKPVETETDSMVLPEWLPLKSLQEFKQHRTKLGSSMSEKAVKLLITELTKIHMQGHNPIECLNTAILKGWKSVYAPQKQCGKQDKFDPMAEIRKNVPKEGSRERVIN